MGIRPIVGITSRTGVIPISLHLDTVGVFSRTVADAIHGLNAIVGEDKEDLTSIESSERTRMTIQSS